MPEYNLGRAHGKIVIDSDKRGIDQSDKALGSFEKTVKKLDRVLDRFEKVLENLEHQLENVESAAKAADRALDDLDGSFVHAGRSARSAGNDMADFQAELQGIAKTAGQMYRVYKVFDHINKSTKEFRKAGTFRQYVTATNKATLFTVGLNRAVRALSGRMIGLNKVYDNFGEKQNKVLRLATAMGKVTLAFAAINRIGPAVRHVLLNAAHAAAQGESAYLGMAEAITKLSTAHRKAFRAFENGYAKLWVTAATGEGRMGKLAKALNKVTVAGDKAQLGFRALYRGANTLFNGLDSATRGLLQMAVGAGFVKLSLDGLAKQFPIITAMLKRLTPSMVVAIKLMDIMSRAAVEILGKGLIWLSNIIAGLVNAVTQLSGGLLILPGIYATLGVSIGVLSAAFKGLGAIFEDVFKNMDDPEKLAEAMAKVPPQFRNLGKVLIDVTKQFKGLQEELVTTFSSGLDRDINTLVKQFMGPLRHGVLTVAQSFVDMRAKLMQFLTSKDTVNDFGLAFQYTSGTIRNMAKAMGPFLNAFRDITVESMKFLRELTGGAETVTQRFAEWAKVNRENGNLMKWMRDAIRGVKDLATGLKNMAQGLYTILTAFADRSGENALERFAKSMEKFNNSMKKSAATGFLKKFGDAVRNLGTEYIEKTIELGKNFYETWERISPVVNEISDAFSNIFIPAIKVASEIIERFFEAFNALGLNDYIGTILGMAAAFKLVAATIRPIKNLFGIFGGSGTIALGFGKAITGIVDALGRFGPVGKKFGGVVSKAGDWVARFAAKLSTVAVAAAVFHEVVNHSGQSVREFNAILAEGDQNLVDYKESLKAAFKDDGGIAGSNVFSATEAAMGLMLSNLQNQADKVPGIWDNITASFAFEDRSKDDSFWGQRNPFAQAESFNNMQKTAQDAQRAKAKFDELGLTTKDLAAIVFSSDSAFKAYNQSLRESGDNGNEAANELERQRAVLKEIQGEYATASAGSVTLVKAIEDIGRAGDDTTSKLTALNNALKALGFNKADEYEAAFAFAQAIEEIGNAAQNAVDQSQPLEGIFGPDGVLATSGPAAANAQNLYNVLKNGVDAFQRHAIASGDVEGAWATLQESLPGLAQAFQTNLANIQGMVTNLTGDDYTVSLLLSVDGEDKLQAQIAAVLLQYQAGGPGAEIKIPLLAEVSEDEVQRALDQAFGTGQAAVGNGFITIAGANLSPEAIASLQKQIPGLKLPGAPTPKPAEIEVSPEAKPGPKPAFQPPPEPESGSKKKKSDPPQVAPRPEDTAALEAANNKVKELEATIASLNEQKTKVEIDYGKVDEAKAKIDELKTKVDEFSAGNIEFTIIANGYDETIHVVGTVKTAITELITEVEKIGAAFGKAFAEAMGHINNFANQAKAKIDALVSGALAQGTQFVNALAQGIRDNPAAIEAAEALAKEIKERFHQSPPKKGPLSAHGDAARYAGKAFVDSYASGVDSNGNAVGAANRMAGGLASAGQGPYELGRLLGVFRDIFGFADKLIDAFSEISDVIFNVAKLMADPMNKGEFFGQKLYGRDPNVSDRQLQRNRDDELQQKISSGVERGARGGIRKGYSSDEALLRNVPAGRYSQTGEADLTKGLADCSSAIEDLVNMMDGRSTGGRSMSTANAAEWLMDKGFLPGSGGPGDMRVAFNVGHMQATLPGGTPFNWGSDSSAARRGIGGSGADDPALNQRFFRPVSKELREQLRQEYARTGRLTQHGISPESVGPDLSELTDVERAQLDNGQFALQTQEQMLDQLRSGDPQLAGAIDILKSDSATNDQIVRALPIIDRAIEDQTAQDTAFSRQNASSLESIRSDAMSSRGLTEQDPIGMVQSMAGQAASFAKDVLASISSVLESVAAASQISDMMVRGLENTEDVMQLIDNFQQFLTTAAQIASTVASGLSIASSIASAAGGADPSGGASGAATGLAAASQIASLISAGISTVNGIIDLAQEAYRITGKYFGEFLGFLTGGAGGQLMGDIKFLLDETDGTLKTWSADNAEDKRSFDNPFTSGGTASSSPRIGEVNIYPERGTDPAQMTNEMMFAVSAASSGAWSD